MIVGYVGPDESWGPAREGQLQPQASMLTRVDTRDVAPRGKHHSDFSEGFPLLCDFVDYDKKK